MAQRVLYGPATHMEVTHTMNRILAVAGLFALACAPAAEFGANEDDLSRTEFTGIETRQALSYLNAVSYDEFVALPFISKPQATATLAHRHGFDAKVGTIDDNLFNSIAEWDAISGIGPATIGSLVAYVSSRGAKDYTTVEGITITRPEANGLVKIANLATFEQLDLEVGLAPYQAQGFMNFRAQGKFTSVDQIAAIPGIGPVAMYKLLAYLWEFEPVSE